MKIQEADAKSLLVAQGLPVPAVGGRPHGRPRRARRPSASSPPAPSAVVIKAQVLVGGRGKAGGVKLAATPDEAETVAGGDPRHGHQGHHGPQGPRRRRPPTSSASSTCRPCSIGPRGGSCSWARPRAASRSSRSRSTSPEAIVRHHADPLLGLLDYQAREFAFAHGSRRPPQGSGRDRQGPRPDDARVRRRPRRDQPAGDRPRDRRRRRRRRAPGLPRRQGHARRLRAPPPSRTRGRCAIPTRRIRPTARRARPA